MHVELAAPVAAQSLISIIISCCTIASSLLTAKLVHKLGTDKLTALSVALTAGAILGFSATNAFWQLCLIAIPYGLGAGAIDSALNNYVALHYGAAHELAALLLGYRRECGTTRDGLGARRAP